MFRYDNEIFDGAGNGSYILSYNDVNRFMTANTSDGDLIGLEKPYSVTASFTTYPIDTYPTVSTAVASNFIEFVDPCLNPQIFVK